MGGLPAKPGTRSIDGTGHNGLYTSVLLKYLPIPGMPIEQMLKKVGTEVRQRSGDQQQTWMEGLLDSGDGGDFCFAGCAGRAVSPTTTLTPKPSPLASKPAPRPTPQRQPLEPATSSRLKTTKSCDICPEMVRLPGGSLRIGSPENESGRDVDEKQRTLTIGSFSIGKYEVTQAEWLALMGSNPSFFSKCENCPVEQVSWEDAQNYILKLNAQTGQSYRLPTEAEWEYACRAGGSHTYCGSDNPGMVAWYDANSGGETHPVGQKSTNGFGLFDMSGNVWELTCSYRSDAYNAVYDGTENRCKDDDISVVQYRGGSWGNTPSFVRSANRNGNNTGYKLSNLGFRLAHD
jgi:formylglycine-generating enzyme required for sulfatase activity